MISKPLIFSGIFLSALGLLACEDTSKYIYTCCDGDTRRVIHRATGTIVVKPVIIIAQFEGNYYYGARLPAYPQRCRTRDDKILRKSDKPVYFILDRASGDGEFFETPLEFTTQNDFEVYLKSIGLSKYDRLNYKLLRVTISNFTNPVINPHRDKDTYPVCPEFN